MIRIGLSGYGNLGKGVEMAISKNSDMSLEAIVTRRNPADLSISTDTPIIGIHDVDSLRDKIDVMILCGGSATDLPQQGPELAELFNTVDSFDNHAKIPEYFASVNEKALRAGNLSLISCGWDPGLFSLSRVLFDSILPDGKEYTFWGRGVSQGHSDTIRRIEGVIDARQYTIPNPSAIEAAKSHSRPDLTKRQKHRRDCYVVAQKDANLETIREKIITMPAYFADYDTQVFFISMEELNKNHAGMPHGGFVIRNGSTSEGTNQVTQFSLQLDSNPEFTASVLTAYARAVYRMSRDGKRGAISVLDVPLAALSPFDSNQLRSKFL